MPEQRNLMARPPHSDIDARDKSAVQNTANDSASGQAPQNLPVQNLPVVVPRPSEIARGGGESWVARALRALFGWKSDSIRDDLQTVLAATSPSEIGFSAEERTMLNNILGLRERRVADVSIPRADIIAVKRDISLGELLREFERAGHSRLVVYRDTLDDPEGMVHIRDLLAFMTTRAEVDADINAKRKKPFPAGLDLKTINLAMPLNEARITRKLIFVPPSMPAIDLLAKMQAARIHLALVVDEYGGTDGLVSIEDLVEQIVGQIDDEHDTKEVVVVQQADGAYIADARASLEDITKAIGDDFNTGEAAEEVDTLGGYLVTLLGRVPVRGEIVSGPGPYEIEVLDADPRRVKRLRIGQRKERASAREREARRREQTNPAASATPGNNGKESGASLSSGALRQIPAERTRDSGESSSNPHSADPQSSNPTDPS
jgi:CBS domain containing-hemolysin-like protein